MELARLAEKLGYDSIWIPDHAHFPLEALVTLTAAARETKEVNLGTGVIDLNRRSLAAFAHAAATLDRVSGGRLILGVGKGTWNEKTYDSLIEKPVSRTKEIIELLRKFWTMDEVDFSGEFFTFKKASIGTKPLQKPHPPIWIAAFGPRMMKITATLGDGFIAQNTSPDIFREDFQRVGEVASQCGRDITRIEPVFVAPVAISKDRRRAELLIGPIARSFLVRRAGPPWNYARRLGYSAPWTGPEQVPLEAIERCFVFGTPRDCLKKIEEYERSGVRYFVALPVMPTGQESIKLFAEEVLSSFS